jgi:hypothetical protein
MASTEELVEAIYRLIASSPTPIPVTLMNHRVDETAAIIGAVVERCARDIIALTEIGRSELDRRRRQVEPNHLAAAEAVSRSGGPIGVYRLEDRLTPPAYLRGRGRQHLLAAVVRKEARP